MPTSVFDRRALFAAAILSGAAVAVPFWIGRFVPLLDLPQHLAVVAVLRHHADPAWGFAPYFDPQWTKLTPYWTFYLATWALSFVTSIENAARVFLTLYALALPWAGIGLARAFGRPAWVGLLAAPLALNTNLYFGFVSYCAGVLLLLVLLADFESGLEAPRFRAGRHALGAALLFFTHVQAFVFHLGAALVLAATRTDVPLARRARRWAALLPATLGLLAPWVYRQALAPRDGGAHYTFGRVGHLGARFQPLGLSAQELPRATVGSFQDRSDLALLAVWALLALTACALGRREKGAARSAVPAGLALLAYFAAPVAVTGQWNIGPRFAWLAALLVLPAAASSERVSRVIGASAVALSVGVGVNAGIHHAAFDREVGRFDAVLDCVPRGARVMPLVFDNRGHVLEQWPYLHFGQYTMVRRGGLTSSNLGRYEPFPIRLRDAASWPLLDPFRPNDFRDAAAGSRYEYILVRGTPADASRLAPLAPVCRQEDWALFRRP